MDQRNLVNLYANHYENVVENIATSINVETAQWRSQGQPGGVAPRDYVRPLPQVSRAELRLLGFNGVSFLHVTVSF